MKDGKEVDISAKVLPNPGEIKTNPPSCYQIQQMVSLLFKYLQKTVKTKKKRHNTHPPNNHTHQTNKKTITPPQHFNGVKTYFTKQLGSSENHFW